MKLWCCSDDPFFFVVKLPVGVFTKLCPRLAGRELLCAIKALFTVLPSKMVMRATHYDVLHTPL
jgi:hypothetical protein